MILCICQNSWNCAPKRGEFYCVQFNNFYFFSNLKNFKRSNFTVEKTERQHLNQSKWKSSIMGLTEALRHPRRFNKSTTSHDIPAKRCITRYRSYTYFVWVLSRYESRFHLFWSDYKWYCVLNFVLPMFVASISTYDWFSCIEEH